MMENGDSFQSCLERIKNVSPGSHVCYFYQTPEDLFDILIPFFAEGLSNGQFCLWVCPDRIQAERARAVFYERFPSPRPEKYFLSGRIKILDATQWYIDPGTRRFSLEFVLERRRTLYAEAVQKGFTGVRASGDTSWLDHESWPAFMDYERYINHVISGSNTRAICTYPLSRCGPPEIIDVTSRHRLSLLRTPSGCKLSELDDLQPGTSAATPQSPHEGSLSPLSLSALSAREEERKKISRSLHSHIGSLSISLSSGLEAVEKHIKAKNPQDALSSLCETHTVLKSEVRKIKNLAYSIRPPELDLGGFPEAVESCFSGLAGRKGVDFRFRCTPSCHSLPQQEATILFRIVHEAINNVLKHARARTLEIRLSQKAGKIRLFIRDDGRGFDPEQASIHPPRTLGLISMKEMAESLGGTFRIQSAPAKGTSIEVLLPENNP